MDTQPLKVGDVVELKSGSSKMTVSAITHDKLKATCIWYDASVKGFDHAEIPVIVLRLALSHKDIE
jgi:uncharacterized protein YodC (DUF2158 family)